MDNIETLKLWMNEMKINNWIHLQTMNYYNYLNKWLSIPPIFISAISGTILLSNTNNIIPSDKLNLATGIILTLSAFLQGMKSFFQLDEKISLHEKYAKLYKEISYEIEEFLIIPQKFRHLLTQNINNENIDEQQKNNSENITNNIKYNNEEILYRFIDNIKKRRIYITSNEPIPPSKLWNKFKDMLKNSKLIHDILDDEIYKYNITTTTNNVENNTTSTLSNINITNITSNIEDNKIEDNKIEDIFIDFYNSNSSIKKKTNNTTKNKYINQIMFNLGQDFEL